MDFVTKNPNLKTFFFRFFVGRGGGGGGVGASESDFLK